MAAQGHQDGDKDGENSFHTETEAEENARQTGNFLDVKDKENASAKEEDEAAPTQKATTQPTRSRIKKELSSKQDVTRQSDNQQKHPIE